jgi:hypothetical protein
MRKLLSKAAIVFMLAIGPVAYAHAQCSVSWNQEISSQADHVTCSGGASNSDTTHFTKTWFPSGGWNGTDGYMRWRVTRTAPEDDDGYWFNHPRTATRPIFISFIARTGAGWWRSHTSADRFKFVMFYNQNGANPRPTIFNMPVFTAPDGGTYRYRTFGPDLEAGGSGHDEFGSGTPSQNYPNHTYKEDSVGHDQWYFIVMSLESDRTKTYIWSQDGRLSGLYAQSRAADSSMVSNWNAQTWQAVRLLGYIEATTAGDSTAFMDIARVRLSQSLPQPPAGFVQSQIAPNPPTDIIVE